MGRICHLTVKDAHSRNGAGLQKLPVDLSALIALQPDCKVEAVKDLIKAVIGSGSSNIPCRVVVYGPKLVDGTIRLGLAPWEPTCHHKFYLFDGKLHRHVADDSVLLGGEKLEKYLTVADITGSPIKATAFKLGSQCINIDVATMTGKLIPVFLPSLGSTVESLKLAVEESEGIPQDQQRMDYAGKQLEDSLTLAEYGAHHGAVVHLTQRVSGGMYHATSGRCDNEELRQEPPTHTNVTVVLPGRGEVQLKVPVNLESGDRLLQLAEQEFQRQRAAYEAAETDSSRADWLDITEQLQCQVLCEAGIGKADLTSGLAMMRSVPYRYPALKQLCIYHRHQRAYKGPPVGSCIPADLALALPHQPNQRPMAAMAQAYCQLASFAVVYVAEAHAEDEWPIKSSRYNLNRGPVLITQHRTTAERCAAAAAFSADFELRLPVLVDPMMLPVNISRCQTFCLDIGYPSAAGLLGNHIRKVIEHGSVLYDGGAFKPAAVSWVAFLDPFEHLGMLL
eukprot:gene1421-1763_t